VFNVAVIAISASDVLEFAVGLSQWTSPVAGGLWWAYPLAEKAPSLPKLNMKYYKSVKFFKF